MENNANMATRYEHEIPEGYESRIEGNKVIIEPIDSEDERIKKEIISVLKFANVRGVYDKHIAYLEKQKEQKSEIKYVYPIFKVGDTIKPKAYNESHRIDKIKDDNYVLDNGFTFPIVGQDVWEIVKQQPVQEIKPIPIFRIGDILKRKGKKFIFIVDKIGDYYYCDSNRGAFFPIKEQNNWELVGRKHIEWSDEEMNVLNSIIDDYEKATKSFCGYDGKITLLKAIRDGEYSLPKQELSEEDKEKIDNIIGIICDARECSKIAKIGEEREDNSAFYNELVLFLKSLCSFWKPNEEQMNALEYFIRSWGESGTMSPQNTILCAAKSLLTDLQKLL